MRAGLGVLVNSGDNTTDYFGVTHNGLNITGQKNVGPGFLYYNIEDQNDTAATSGFLGPRYGGQDYDAEFLGVLFNGNTISIGILTGQRFDNTLTNFSPGDIRIRTTLGEFWVEVGGSGNGSDGVSLGENGSTYTLKKSGFTSSVNSSEAIKAGTIVKNPSVINAVPAFPSGAVPVQIDPTTDLNVSKTFTAQSYAYTYYAGSQHAGIEVKFDAASVFGAGNTISSVEWRPSCGNDEVL